MNWIEWSDEYFAEAHKVLQVISRKRKQAKDEQLEADNFSLQGLYHITDIAHQMQRHNPKLKIYGTILTRFDGRPKLNRYLQKVIADKGKAAGAPLLAEIRRGVAIREAQALQLSLYDYAPKSKPAQDYKKLYEIINKRR